MSEESKGVKEFIDPAQFKQDVEYSPADLDTAMVEQASLSAFYGAASAESSRQAGIMKIRLGVVEAKVYKEIRDAANDEKRKMTEAQIKAEVETDPRVIKAKSDYINATYYADLGKSAVESFKQRRDMLIQLGSSAREERKGELFIKGGSLSDLQDKAHQAVGSVS